MCLLSEETEHQECLGRRCAVREQDLPTCVRDVLDATRMARPDVEILCVSFRTLQEDQEIARMEPDPELMGCWCSRTAGSRPVAKNVVVLSVSVTETSFDAVR